MRKKIEIAAVLGLVIVGIALCVAGNQKVQEAAGRGDCTNNLKQFGLAIHNYHDANKRFPHAIARPPTADFPPESQISWFYVIMPYLQAHMDPKFVADIKKPWDDPRNDYVATRPWATYPCPANLARGEKYRLAHYVGITGVGKDAAWLPLGDAKDGFFGYERNITNESIEDGTSTTIMVAETGRDNGPWLQGGFATTRGIDRGEPGYLGEDGQFLSFHRSASWFGFRSYTHVAMADASVRTLSNRVSDDVFESLATYAGGEKVLDEDLNR